MPTAAVSAHVIAPPRHSARSPAAYPSSISDRNFVVTYGTGRAGGISTGSLRAPLMCRTWIPPAVHAFAAPALARLIDRAPREAPQPDSVRRAVSSPQRAPAHRL